MNLVDKTVQDALLEDWRQWTVTQKQYDSFKLYCIPLLKKVFKCNKSKAEGIFNYFSLMHGLKIQN